MALRDLLFNSDMPIDNIVFLASGSVLTPNGTSDNILVATHGLSFTPLSWLIWSNDPDFTTSNSFVDTAAANTWFTGALGQTYLTYATSTGLYIQRDNKIGSDKMLYWRIFCFPPSDIPIDATVASTALASDPFIINSDYNYLKLLKAGKLDYTTTTYSHNLGYTPRVMKWAVISGSFTQPVMEMIQADSDPDGSLGQTNGVYADKSVVRWLNPNSFDYIEYRVYVD